MAMEQFSPAVREWFTTEFPEPTAAQLQDWPAIAAGQHTLICAPTGSGKTLAAFLWGIDQLVSSPPPDPKQRRTRLLYLSPLRALAFDVEKNLRAPLAGIRLASERLGLAFTEPSDGLGAVGPVVNEPTSGPAAAGPFRKSISPSIYPHILGLVLQHRSTIIFCNARRLAERLAVRLNEQAETEGVPTGGTGVLVRAHH